MAKISIHAPARGGDAAYQLKIDALEISIHAPARGGATHQLRTDLSHQGISIHAPARGGDHHGVHLVHRGRIISIHAPARGGDAARCGGFIPDGDFNPRPREGGRQQRCTVLPADL